MTLELWSIEGITFTCCAWPPFPCPFQCWPWTWIIPPKNHYKTSLEEIKAGTRAVWPKLSVLDCQSSETLCNTDKLLSRDLEVRTVGWWSQLRHVNIYYIFLPLNTIAFFIIKCRQYGQRGKVLKDKGLFLVFQSDYHLQVGLTESIFWFRWVMTVSFFKWNGKSPSSPVMGQFFLCWFCILLKLLLEFFYAFELNHQPPPTHHLSNGYSLKRQSK